MSNQIPRPTEAELEILQVLWLHGPSSVRFINDELNKKRDLGYTSTLKLMQIMHEKGLLIRDATERSHIFTAAMDQESTQHKMLNQLLDVAYNGSAANLVMQALGNHKATTDELEAIRTLLNRIEKEQS